MINIKCLPRCFRQLLLDEEFSGRSYIGRLTSSCQAVTKISTGQLRFRRGGVEHLTDVKKTFSYSVCCYSVMKEGHLRGPPPCTYCKSLLLVTPTTNVQCNISHDFRQLFLNGDFLADPSREGRDLYVDGY